MDENKTTTIDTMEEQYEDLAARIADGGFEQTDDDRQRFRVTDDACADWCVERINEARAEYARLEQLAELEKARIDDKLRCERDKCDGKVAFFSDRLAEYFETVEHKVTKAGARSYKLFNGTLRRKAPTVEYTRDDGAIIGWLKEAGRTEFVKTEEKLAWGDFKKTLTVAAEGIVVDASGEVVVGITAETKPGAFEVKEG